MVEAAAARPGEKRLTIFRPLALALGALVFARALPAQCPDGTPPPCATSRIAAALARSGSVAILYIQSRDSADAYLADGLTEDVTTLLSRRAGVAVKPSSSVRLAQRRQPDAAARALGRTLAVRWVVQGSLRRAADRVRLNVQLVDASSDVSVWGETYDRTARGMLDLPTELANEIANRVGGTPAARAPAVQVWRTTNPLALDHFRRGNFFMATRSHLPEAFAEYQEAARLDPRFVSAVARSAYVLALQRNAYGIDSVSRGLQLAGDALRLDSTSSDAWMALGFLRAYADTKTLAGASDAFERAIALDSTNAEAWHQYGQVLSWLGDDAGAAHAVERALAIEPARAISLSDLSLYAFTRDPARAVVLLDSAVAISREVPNAWRALGLAHLRLAQPRAALADADSLSRWAAQRTIAAAEAGLRVRAWVMLGDTARARDAARGLPLAFAVPGDALAASALLTVGDTATVLERLEAIPAAGRNAMLWWILRLPEFDALRANPRFARVYNDARPVSARSP